jgi:predicted dehydrogenase
VQDIEVILRDPEIDAMVIASPTATHYELVRAGLAAGKHVRLDDVYGCGQSQRRRVTPVHF